MAPDFKPSRRFIKYLRTGVVKTVPVINDLQFIQKQVVRGYASRFGLPEIQQPDFELIGQAFLEIFVTVRMPAKERLIFFWHYQYLQFFPFQIQFTITSVL